MPTPILTTHVKATTPPRRRSPRTYKYRVGTGSFKGMQGAGKAENYRLGPYGGVYAK